MIPLTIISFKRRIRLGMFKFERLSLKQKLVILVAMGLILWYLGGSAPSDEPETSEEVLHAIQQNVIHYCNHPMRTFGTEGTLSLENQRFKLEMVQVLIRHGDRAPNVDILNMDNAKYDFDCTFNAADGYHKKLFEEYKESVKYFHLRKFVSSAKITQSLVPEGGRCQFGQLTQRGFLQHFELGNHLKEAYNSLITSDVSSVLVRSSERQRCIQSAAAFLFGLLTQETIRKGIVINVTSDIWFREDDSGKPLKCPTLFKMLNQYKQRKDYKTEAAKMEPLMMQFAELLRVSRESLPTITYLTDAIYTRYCHKHPLPCGPRGCVSQGMAAKAMKFASWAFAENYTPIAEVATQPMLIHMTKRMIDKLQHKSPLTFVLYSGHDSTITPLLLNLGVHDKKKWTPYSTNVAIELWKDLDGPSKEKPTKSYYFRLLVNGKVMTSKMKFCRDALLKGELCPIQELIVWLSDGSGIQGMEERYQYLCS